MAAPARVCLADLLSAPIAPTVRDAVAVIVQLARSPQTGRPIRQRLDASQVWLDADGSVTVSPGLYPPLWEIGALLDHLLGRVETAAGMPRGLVTIVQQAVAHEDRSAIPTLSALAAALAPFQPSDPAAAIRALVAKLNGGDEEQVDGAATPEDAPVEAAGLAPETTPESAPPQRRSVPSPQPDSIAPHDSPVLAEPLPQPPAPPAPSWQPSRRQIAAVMAAALLAAAAGGAAGRWRHETAVHAAAPPAANPPAVHEAAAPAPSTPGLEPQPIAAPAKPPVPRPDQLVDRKAVHADGVFSPSFATHGSAVFFHAEEGAESALKRAELDDRGDLRVATLLDDGARNYHVQLSPDGRSIAFDSDREGERGVYVAKADGTDVHRVSGPGYAAVPTWSPDGRRLAMLRAEPNRPAVWNLWLLDRDTGQQTRVTQFRSGQVWGGAWFADGNRIAYSHEDRLHIHDLATNETREFASPLRGRLVRTPAVSPDGRWIVFQVYRDGAWLLDVEHGAMQRVLQDPSAEEFAWSPDGRRVAYHSQRSGGWNLWTMAAP